MERTTNEWVVDKVGSGLMLRRSMAERKMRFFATRQPRKAATQFASDPKRWRDEIKVIVAIRIAR